MDNSFIVGFVCIRKWTCMFRLATMSSSYMFST